VYLSSHRLIVLSFEIATSINWGREERVDANLSNHTMHEVSKLGDLYKINTHFEGIADG